MPAPFFYASVEIAGTANEEELDNILTSTEEEPLHIEGIGFFETTAGENHDADIRVYIEREKIGEMAIGMTLLSHDSDLRLCSDPFMVLGHDLPVGQSLKIGHVSGAVASDVQYSVRYSIR